MNVERETRLYSRWCKGDFCFFSCAAARLVHQPIKRPVATFLFTFLIKQSPEQFVGHFSVTSTRLGVSSMVAKFFFAIDLSGFAGSLMCRTGTKLKRKYFKGNSHFVFFKIIRTNLSLLKCFEWKFTMYTCNYCTYIIQHKFKIPLVDTRT